MDFGFVRSPEGFVSHETKPASHRSEDNSSEELVFESWVDLKKEQRGIREEPENGLEIEKSTALTSIDQSSDVVVIFIKPRDHFY